MIAAVRAEWGKTWSLRSSWLCVLATLGVLVVTSSSLANDFVHGITIGEHAATDLLAAREAAGPATQLALVVFAAFAMGLITSEYAGASVRTTFQAEPRRLVVLGAKVLTALAVGAVTGTVSGGAGIAVAQLMLGANAAPWPEPVWLAALRVGLLFAVGAALVVGLGAVIRSAVGTLAAATVLFLGLQLLPSATSRWTPAGAAAEFLGVGPGAYPASMGLVVLVGWAVAVLAVAAVTLRRRDA